jgi:hypothetical protein
LEVSEPKVTAPTEDNVVKDRLQLEKNLQTYAFNNHVIERAALVYVTPTEVVVLEVYCHWIVLRRKETSVTGVS